MSSKPNLSSWLTYLWIGSHGFRWTFMPCHGMILKRLGLSNIIWLPNSVGMVFLLNNQFNFPNSWDSFPPLFFAYLFMNTGSNYLWEYGRDSWWNTLVNGLINHKVRDETMIVKTLRGNYSSRSSPSLGYSITVYSKRELIFMMGAGSKQMTHQE